MRQLHSGMSDAASQLVTMYAPATSPPISTSSQPRWRAGIVSAIRVNMIGSIPPTPSPMTKHISMLSQNCGIEPQMLVAMNAIAAIMIDARRPMRSPIHPQRNEPSTVPVIPESGSSAAGIVPALLSGDLSPYSMVMPGSTKESVAGFITSIVTASAITSMSARCALLTGTSSSARTRTCMSLVRVGEWSRGTRPNTVSASPARISAMPMLMVASTGIPTSL